MGTIDPYPPYALPQATRLHQRQARIVGWARVHRTHAARAGYRVGTIDPYRPDALPQAIFEAVHETANDLHSLGFIDKRTMRKFDLLCLDPIPEYSGEKIRALRDQLQLSQSVLAAVLNTSLSTVRKWEVGDKLLV